MYSNKCKATAKLRRILYFCKFSAKKSCTSARPFPSGGFPPKIRSRPAVNMQIAHFYLLHASGTSDCENANVHVDSIYPLETVLLRRGTQKHVGMGAIVSKGIYAICIALRHSRNQGVELLKTNKNTQKLAYMQFLLYLCTRF